MAGAIVGFVLLREFDADTQQHRLSDRLYQPGRHRPRGRAAGGSPAPCSPTARDPRSAGYRFAELDVDAESPTGAGPLYERAGFATFARRRIFGRRSEPRPAPPDPFSSPG